MLLPHGEREIGRGRAIGRVDWASFALNMSRLTSPSLKKDEFGAELKAAILPNVHLVT